LAAELPGIFATSAEIVFGGYTNSFSGADSDPLLNAANRYEHRFVDANGCANGD
jgi:hypothetical protein